jgi:hypothetical protein
MSVTVTFNGNTYFVPQEGEVGWGNLTDYLVALSNAAVSGAFSPPLRIINNSNNNSFVEAGITGTLTSPNVTNLQSCSANFVNTNAYMFTVAFDSGETLVCAASYKQGVITVLTDVDGIFLSTDAGTGFYIGKSTNSPTITFKNRTGLTKAIEIKTITTNLSSVTNWA